MKRSSVIVAAYLLLVFASGAAVGAFAHYLYTSTTVSAKAAASKRPNESEYRQKYIDEMRTRLHLSDAQVADLNQILEDTKTAYREKIRPQLRTLQADQTEKVRSILDQPQRDEYEKMRQEREKKSKEKGSSGC